MATDIDFLVGQLSEEKESWKVDHEKAMQCRDLEDLIEKGLGFFSLIRLADNAWSRKVQEAKVLFNRDRARELHGAYQWWLGPCDEILRLIDDMERTLPVERSAEFRKARLEAQRTASVNLDELIQSMDEASKGQWIDWKKDDNGAVCSSSNQHGA